ncbi:hypothetical protein BGX34_003229 [Mortierella sp. NVP85]|nr:hypothetical protein BGX34_003229 [Mortierella sp. NVP85]
MDPEKMRRHLQNIQCPDFDPKNYKDRSYMHRGSIHTDGFRLQLIAFKFKELDSVRYRILCVDVLPLQINSTTDGVDYFLTEIRNVVKTPKTQPVIDIVRYPCRATKHQSTNLGLAARSDRDSVEDIFGEPYMVVVGCDQGEIVTAAYYAVDPQKPNQVQNLSIKRAALYATVFA